MKLCQLAIVLATLAAPSAALSNDLSQALKLADVGDVRAGPILLTLFQDAPAGIDGPNGHRILLAFGKLRYRPAAPLLATRLMTPPKLNGDSTRLILKALADIGDPVVTNVLHQYLDTGPPPREQTVARCVLIQLEDADPVPGLLSLLDDEFHDLNKTDIIDALVSYRDERVVSRLAAIAAETNLVLMRREAIDALSAIGDKRSLLALASLLDVARPLDALELRWEGEPSIATQFPQAVAERLKTCTKQDFGTNRSRWEQWVNVNMAP